MAESKKETIPVALPQKPETARGHPHEGSGHEVLRILGPTVPALAANLKKALPQITGSAIVQTSPVMVRSSHEVDAFDSIPRWFCWGLLGISALIFFIQIWNYALS